MKSELIKKENPTKRMLKRIGKIALWVGIWIWITFSLAATFGTI